MMHSLWPWAKNATYRYRMRAASGGKAVPWLQYRVLGCLWWRWHSPVANDLNATRAQLIATIGAYKKLQDDLIEGERWLKGATEEVAKSGLENQSHPFRARWYGKESPIPDQEDALKNAMKEFTFRKQGSPRDETEGTRSAYYLDHFKDMQMNRVKEGKPHFEHELVFKPPNQDQQQQGNRKNRGQQNQQQSKDGPHNRTLTINLDDQEKGGQ